MKRLVAGLAGLALVSLCLAHPWQPLIAQSGAVENEPHMRGPARQAPNAPNTEPCAREDESRELTKIAAARDRETAAFNAGNTTELATVLASDYLDLPDGRAAIAGREAGRAHFAAALAQYATKAMTGHLSVEPDGVWIDGSLAVEHGRFIVVLKPTSGQGQERRIEKRYVEVWRRQDDGSWQVACDMDNAAAPREP